MYIYRTKTLFKMLLVHCDASKLNESELKKNKNIVLDFIVRSIIELMVPEMQ